MFPRSFPSSQESRFPAEKVYRDVLGITITSRTAMYLEIDMSIQKSQMGFSRFSFNRQ